MPREYSGTDWYYNQGWSENWYEGRTGWVMTDEYSAEWGSCLPTWPASEELVSLGDLSSTGLAVYVLTLSTFTINRVMALVK